MFTSKKVRLNRLPQSPFALFDTPKLVSLKVMIISRFFQAIFSCLI